MDMTLRSILGSFGRHFTTFVAILGVLWMVGKPHAQQLIEDTVDGRLDGVELQVNQLEADIERLVRGQVDETKQSRGEAAALIAILCAVKPEARECRQ